MAYLITYPKSKIDPDIRLMIERQARCLYLPLRRLEPKPLSVAQLARIMAAKYLMITSQFALELVLKAPNYNSTATYLVISEKMANKLRSQKAVRVVVAPEENQKSLIKLIENRIKAPILWLSGNLVANQNQQIPVNITKIMVYQNLWQSEDIKHCASEIDNNNISKILVSSPSAAKRLYRIMKLIPEQFINTNYYALGSSTETELRKYTNRIFMVKKHNNVLNRTVLLMASND